jgi:iron-sulfur cluster repair protein YtfE (RIC family)
MVESTSPSAGLFRDHAELQRGVADLARAAAEVSDWSVPDTPDRLRRVRSFLYGQLIPHAEAEEAVLYPFMDKVMGAEQATATMVADHREIHQRADAVADLADSVAQGPPDHAELEALREHLYGLWAIIRLHLDKEEQLLFPMLDGRLSPADARTLRSEMAAVEGDRHPDPS